MLNQPIFAQALTGWLPEKIIQTPGSLVCQWFYSGQEPFSEPFFDETIGRCRALLQNHQKFKPATGAEALEQWAPPQTSVPPSAIIFHVSRCGSTLLSQMLGCLPQHIVLPEVPFFDALLRLPLQRQDVKAEAAQQLLGRAVKWYGQQRTGAETRLFIKTDSWHVFFYEHWRRLYPQTPFIFLYRHPAEVLRSQRRNRGMHAIPGFIEPALFGIDRNHIRWQDFDHWLCLVLERYFERFISITQNDPLTLPLSFHEGMMPVLRRMAAFCNLNFTDDEWRLMDERTRFHGKFPGQPFEEPPAETPWPDEMQAAIELFGQLEAAGRKQA